MNKIENSYFQNTWGGGGAHPKKNQKTSRYTKIGKLALVFLVFLASWFWPEFEIGNWFFFGFFWVFFGFLA